MTKDCCATSQTHGHNTIVATEMRERADVDGIEVCVVGEEEGQVQTKLVRSWSCERHEP